MGPFLLSKSPLIDGSLEQHLPIPPSSSGMRAMPASRKSGLPEAEPSSISHFRQMAGTLLRPVHMDMSKSGISAEMRAISKHSRDTPML